MVTGDAPSDASPSDAPGDVANEPSCDDDAGGALMCTDAGMAACSLADMQCAALAANLKPKVANAMYTCVATSSCMTGDFTMCIQASFSAACPDDSASAPCMTIVTACGDAGGLTLDGCKAMLAPMTAAGRSSVVACAAGDAGGGVGACNLMYCVQNAL